MAGAHCLQNRNQKRGGLLQEVPVNTRSINLLRHPSNVVNERHYVAFVEAGKHLIQPVLEGIEAVIEGKYCDQLHHLRAALQESLLLEVVD